MAFLGDLGKFFGLPSTKSVVSTGASFLGFNPIQSNIIGKTVAGFGSGTADQPQQQSALPTGPEQRNMDTGAQEDAGSGTTILNVTGQPQMRNEASFGSLLPLIQGAGRLLSSRGGQIATGVGLTGAGALFGSNGQEKPVLTQSRRNKAKVRQLVNFMGIEGTADFLSQSVGQNVSPNDVVALLLRTFRNDGAFITKAQVRNLRRTTNRFKSLEKQVKEAVSMGTTRRAPVRRTVNRSTSIKI
tara:strand:- start:239 stop:967 length:729 start_codon:yes stop_codon:yes gene_type:complete